MKFGSFTHLFYPIFFLLLLAIFTRALRRKRVEFRNRFILFLSLLNALQHLFKGFLYPHLFGTGFSYLNSGYNLCGLLILAFFPLFATKWAPCRDFLVYVGGMAGFLPILFPVWFFGKSGHGWELFRFYLCHGLLFLSACLPLTTGVHRIRVRRSPLVGLFLLCALFCVFLNDVLLVFCGLLGSGVSALYPALLQLNPMMIMKPAKGYEFLADFLAPITPKLFLDGEKFAPVLWYAFPLFLLVTFLAYLVGFWLEKVPQKNFRIGRKDDCFFRDFHL